MRKKYAKSRSKSARHRFKKTHSRQKASRNSRKNSSKRITRSKNAKRNRFQRKLHSKSLSHTPKRSARKSSKPTTRVLSRSKNKTLISPLTKEKFRVAKQSFGFDPVFRVSDPKSERHRVESFIENRLLPKALRFFKRYQRKSEHLWLIRIVARHNRVGRRVEIGFSIPRFLATTQRGFTLSVREFVDAICKRFEVYMDRKGMNSITINSFTIEVVL